LNSSLYTCAYSNATFHFCLDALNEVEQALATRRDVSTVLDVFGRPIAFKYKKAFD